MADDLCGRTLRGFVVREKLADGGYGTLYRCSQPLLKRDVVIKVLRKPQRGKEVAEERFVREAQLASRLDHPYAAHVYDFGVEEDGLRWIAMELVSGTTLDERLCKRGPMSLDEFVPFFECIAEVVHAAHARGIVHRDIKPANVMVIEEGGRLFPKLLDFGIAKESHEVESSTAPEAPPEGSFGEGQDPGGAHGPNGAVTRTDPTLKERHLTPPGAGIGSWWYMSPEQWRDAHAAGPASDIYSLGVLAYKALSGRVPFSAQTEHECYLQHLHAAVPPLGDDFPPEFDRIFQRALAKTPDVRHRTAQELASELRATLMATERELLRSLARQWEARAQAPDLLLGGDVLAGVERWTSQAPPGLLSRLECSYVAASQRRARRMRWLRRMLAAVAVATAIGGLQYRSAMHAQLAAEQARVAEDQVHLAKQQTRAARELAEARVTESELERGRAALLHGEPEAIAHLMEAYKRDPSPTTAFMLARSMQPRLAEQARFASTHGRMWSATFSPDGRQVATTDDRAAQIWDAQTHQLLFTLPHGCEVYQAVYSPDGKWLVTVAETAVKIWDTATGAHVRDLKAEPDHRVPSDYYRGAISPDGQFVAAMNASGSVVHVWSAANGALVAELRNHAAMFPRLAFSPDGWLATTGGDEVRVYEVRTWRQVVVLAGPIHSLAFDAHSRLVTGTSTGDAALWAIPTGARLRHLRQFGEGIEAVAFSPDGHLVSTGSRDGAMQVWDAASGMLRSQLNPRHSMILGIEFDPTSTLLLAANVDGTIAVADVVQGLPVAILQGPQNIVRVAHFDANLRVVGASWDGTARIWDAASPYRRWSSEPMSDDCGYVMGSEPDGRFVAVGCRNHPTRVWDTARDRLLAELPSVTLIASGGYMSAFPAVSAGGDRAAIARGNAVEVYELPGGRLVRTITHGSPVNAIAFGITGREVVSGAVDGSVLVTHQDGAGRALQASAGIDAAELLPDGRVIVSDAARRLRVYAPDGAVLADLEMPVRIMSLRYDGARVVALPSYNGTATSPLLIDLERYRIVAQLAGHVGRVFSARWVSAERIITAGADGTVRLWDGATGQLRNTYRGGSRFLADATLTADGLVVGGDADGLLRFWDAASGAKLWTLQAHRSAVIGVHLENGDIVTRGFTGEVSRWRLPNPDQVISACADDIPCAIVP